MERKLFYCENCGRAFLLKSYLMRHECDALKESLPEDEGAEDSKELSRAELIEIAKEKGLKGAARMKKSALEEALK